MTSPLHLRKSRFAWLVGAAVSVALLTFGLASWMTFQSYRFVTERLPVISRLAALRAQILFLDEALTTSAQMSAATGAFQWEARHRQLAPRLDRSIEEAKLLMPELADDPIVAEIDAANTKLIAMKERAFELARQGQQAEARLLLSSDEYVSQKQVYGTSVGTMGVLLGQVGEAASIKWQHQARIGLLLGVTWAPLLILGSLLMLRFTHRRETALHTERLLAANERDLIIEKAREAEAQFHYFFESSTNAVVMTNADGGIVRANRQTEAVFGYELGELAGQSVELLVPGVGAGQVPTDPAHTSAPTLRPMESEFESIAVRRDGTTFVADVKRRPVESTGGIMQLFAVCDITESRRAEDSLRSNERKYRDLFESSRDAIMTIEPPSWRFTSANRSALTMFEVESERDFVSLRPDDVSPDLQPDGRASSEKAEEMIKTAMREGSTFFEWTHRRLGGREFVSTVLLSRSQSDGKEFLQATVRDISEHKRAAESHTRLAAAVDQSPEAVLITDANAKIVYVNPAFERASGYTGKEVTGQNPRFLKSGKQNAEFYRQMWADLAAGRVWSGTIINKRKDGTLYEEDSTISPLRDGAGKTINYVAAQRDVTEEKQLRAQFRQAQKMESVGLLAGGIAHDFNNLLTVINGTAELAAERLGALDPLRADLGEIRQAGERAALLTRQLLAFSRTQIMQRQVLNLATVVASVEPMLRRLIGEDVELVLVPTQCPASVNADQGLMEQVLLNLVVNARDSMPRGGQLTLEVRSVSLDEQFGRDRDYLMPAGTYVVLVVSDTGTGMNEATRRRIFEPFFTTKGPGAGTGLGLSTVYGIVKQSDGFIEVESDVGQGTSFKIYLPQAVGVTNGRSSRSTDVVKRGTETIVVVEDVDGLRLLTKRMLESAGYTVLTAPGGEEALLLLERHGTETDLVITDVVMPGMSGRTLMQRLNETGRERGKVLYMSGYTDDVVVRNGALDESMPFIGKPFTVAELTRKVREVLDAAS